MKRPLGVPRIALLASVLAAFGSLACQQEEETIAAKDYPARMAAGYCKAVYECSCDDYPYADVNVCFSEVTAAYDELNDEAFLAGLAYDGSCPAKELDQIDALACTSFVPEQPAGVCIRPCNAWHGTAGIGALCEVVASSAELGRSFSNCAQGLACAAGVCVDPCQAVSLPGIGEPCPELLCEAGAVCDETMTCIAAPTLPGPGEACADGLCDANRAVCVPEANVCAALPSAGQACIEGQCDRNSYCDIADDVCVAAPALACFLLGAGDDPVPGDGDGDGDPTTGDGDGDPTTGDGDPDTWDCGDGTTIPVDFVCDGGNDCENWADEITGCGIPAFICDDGTQIPADYVCDNITDCPDGSDELSC